ncbi:hypothetical protein GBAR_LOCUS12639, partial [Geodia barretti]
AALLACSQGKVDQITKSIGNAVAQKVCAGKPSVKDVFPKARKTDVATQSASLFH